jgi:urease accessory protein
MLIFTTRLESQLVQDADLVIELDHEQRRRSRFVVTLLDGTQVGIALPRGTPIGTGDWLASSDGKVALVQAAQEDLSVATTADYFALLRAAYHLGNRHTSLQLEMGRLYYPHDPVLDQLCVKLGLEVTCMRRPFFPELLLAVHNHPSHTDPVNPSQLDALESRHPDPHE